MNSIRPDHSYYAALLLGALALSTAPSYAQCLNPNIGVGTSSGSDTVTLCAPLGFSFPFPNGSTSSAVSCDSNGRIFPVGGDTSDFSASVGELLSDTTALCPLWTDQGGGPFDDVYCFSNGVDTAVITWVDTRYNFGATPFTVQAELHADGSFRFVYDERMRDVAFDSDPVIVGYTAGGGLATDPGPSDWSTVVFGGSIDSGSEPIGYQLGEFDLSGIALDFTPNGSGGYTTTASTCGLAFVAPFGDPCQNRPPTSVSFIAGLFGSFNASRGLFEFDDTPGIPMGHLDDTIRSANLGFDMRMPDGTLVNTIDVDSNGRILQVGSDTSDFTPSVAEMLAESSHFCPFWTDLVTTADSSVDFFTNGVDFATVTWRNVLQFGTANRITVQAQIRRSGLHSLSVAFKDTSSFGPRNLLIGMTAGNGAADPGEIDLDLGTSGFIPTIYEFFQPTFGDVYDMQPLLPSATLSALSHPVNGTMFQVELTGMQPTNLGSFIMLGFTNVNANLAVLGLPCTLYSDNALAAVAVAGPGATSATWSLPISSVGTPLVLQGAIVDPGVNSLGLDLTAALEVLTGL